jgi:hypothetical protein
MADENTPSIDKTPISHVRSNPDRRKSLEFFLSHRPDRQELVDSKRLPRFSLLYTVEVRKGIVKLTILILSVRRKHTSCVFSGAQHHSATERGEHGLVFHICHRMLPSFLLLAEVK